MTGAPILRPRGGEGAEQSVSLSEYLQGFVSASCGYAPLISITGGGGKTSLLYMLGRALSSKGPTLLTTTTKIYRPEPDQCRSLFLGPASYACRFVSAMERPALLTAAEGEANGKMTGYSTGELDETAAAFPDVQIIAECDGSRGISVKYYEEWEPPVPARTELLFAVAGADSVGLSADEAHIFRAESFCAHFGVKYREPLAARDFLRYIISDAGPLKNCPEAAKKVLLINKWDIAPESIHGDICGLIHLALARYDAVICASVRDDRIFKVLER